MAPVVVKAYYGAKNGSKNSFKYLKDVKFAVKCSSSQVSPNAIGRLSKITFQNNLWKAAFKWYIDFLDQVKRN